MIKVLVLGDSHSQVFKYCNRKQQKIHFNVIFVPGATAQGAVNPTSKTNALNIFKQKLNDIKQNDFQYVIINLGEVDCGYLIWYRIDKYNISIGDQLKTTTNNLFHFIKTEVLSKFEASKIIVNGSILPTIKDNTNKNILNGQRGSVKASQSDRTLLTIRYNNILKKYSLENGYNYMDITHHILNTNTNTVKTIYLNKKKYEHHLDIENTYPLWLIELCKIIKQHSENITSYHY